MSNQCLLVVDVPAKHLSRYSVETLTCTSIINETLDYIFKCESETKRRETEVKFKVKDYKDVQKYI